MLSLPHLIVVFLIALIILGPQKLPELARMLGKASAEFRKMSSDFRYALEDEVREMERQTRIREEEVAAAARAAQTPATPPENAVPRSGLPEEVPVVLNAVSGSELLASPSENLFQRELPPAETPAEPEAVSTSQEKPPDDHAAV